MFGLATKDDISDFRHRFEIFATNINQKLNIMADKLETLPQIQTALDTANDQLLKIRKEQQDSRTALGAQVVDLKNQIDELNKKILEGAAPSSLIASTGKLLSTINDIDADVDDAPAPPAGGGEAPAAV